MIAISMTVFLNDAVNASEIKTEAPAGDPVLMDDSQVNTAKLIGLSRNRLIELLGQPQRCEEFFPYSNRQILVDYYKTKNNAEHLRVTYDSGSNVSAAEVEPTPSVIPKFMGIESSSSILTDSKLRNFSPNYQRQNCKT